MNVLTKKYTDLDRAIDEVQSLSKSWSAARLNGSLDDETIQCTSLVLHEWIANLHQHADFRDDPPMVEVRLSQQEHRVYCSVTDNSEGFELDAHFPTEDDHLEPLPERGMGLRIIKTCTDDLSYTQTNDGLYRFEFIIPADHDPWLNTLF